MKDLLAIICFVKSGLFAFLFTMVCIMMILPESMLEIFGFLTVIGLIGFIVFYIISLFK